MAPQRIAEELVGFPSGTMTPICHSVDMKLYLEESIVDNMEDPARHKLLVGSGMMGTCLSISADKFLAVAKSNSKGLSVCSLVQKNK
jgi:prolyl-tRNA editing enzyme YbaK/EbsC (Cys-tRNA(Pro) deacylase)